MPALFNPNIVINQLTYWGFYSTIISYQFFKAKEISNKFILNLNQNSISKLISFFGYTHFLVSIFNALQVVKSNPGSLFVRNRLETYFDSQITSSNVLFPISLISEGFFYILLARLFSKNKFIFFFLLITYVFSISVFANTRLAVIMPLISFFCFYTYRFKKKPFYFLKYSFGIIIFLFVYVQLSNQLRNGIDTSVDDVWNYKDLIARELDYNKYLDLAEDYVIKEGQEYGYGWFIGSFGNLVPRSFWSDKPTTSSSNRYTIKVTGKELSLLNTVITFTIFGDGYFQFGYFGLIIETILFLYCVIFLFNSLMKLISVDGTFYAFHLLVMSFIYFRAEFPFVQYLITFLTIVVVANKHKVKHH